MARRKQFNDWDNQERFEDAHTTATNVAADLEGVVNEDLFDGLDKSLDAMGDRFHDLQAHAEELESKLESAVSLEDYNKTVDRLEKDIAVLKARLQLAGLSTSVKATSQRQRRAADLDDDCPF